MFFRCLLLQDGECSQGTGVKGSRNLFSFRANKFRNNSAFKGETSACWLGNDLHAKPQKLYRGNEIISTNISASSLSLRMWFHHLLLFQMEKGAFCIIPSITTDGLPEMMLEYSRDWVTLGHPFPWNLRKLNISGFWSASAPLSPSLKGR